MCISPNYIWIERGPKWEQQPVACRQCWRCHQNRVNDYVARCMAESSTSIATCAITLTYAPRDDLADKVLFPSHFQRFIKLLRHSGHLVRYLVAGEYGDLKGRTHFHALLFFQHIKPSEITPFYNPAFRFDSSPSAPFSDKIPNMNMVHIREWPHGHVTCDWSANERAARYVCKYLLKNEKGKFWFSLSKKPPLGAVFFAQKAEKAKSLSVLPSSFNYLPPGGNKERPYLMTGATRRDYLNAITTDPSVRSRLSEWVLKSFDKYALKRFKDFVESVPPDLVEASYAELYERRAEIEAAKQRRDRESLTAYIEQAIEAASGPVSKDWLSDYGK